MVGDAESIRDLLRSAVLQAMKRRDRALLAMYRTALAAIDNAESVPGDEQYRAGAIELSPVGLGRADVPRRHLTEQDMIDIVLAEVHARRAAADALAGAEPGAAQQLRGEADVLRALLRRAGTGT